MPKVYKPGAVGALLDEYEKAITELQHCIKNMTDNDLTLIVDSHTTNDNCRSVQTILSHVVSSAYSYAVYVHNLYAHELVRPAKVMRLSALAYVQDLTDAFQFTLKVFENIDDAGLEQHDPARKIRTNWGQVYDTEQLMEHAIVHILRHRRQIEKFKLALGKA